MRVCSACGQEKPEACFAGSACARCLGTAARRTEDQSRGLRHKKRLAEESLVPYPYHPGPSTNVPIKFFEKWCADMKAMLPTQWDGL